MLTSCHVYLKNDGSLRIFEGTVTVCDSKGRPQLVLTPHASYFRSPPNPSMRSLGTRTNSTTAENKTSAHKTAVSEGRAKLQGSLAVCSVFTSKLQAP